AQAADRECGGQADWRIAAENTRGGARMAFEADRREAGSDAACDRGRADGARGGGELWHGVELLRRGEHQLQKKPCTPPSRTGPTWREGAHSGRSTRIGLNRGACVSFTI